MKYTVDKAINKDVQQEINRSLIFQLIRNSRGISQANIVRNLGLSPATVSRIVDELLTNKYIVQGEKQAHSYPGKPSAPLYLNPEMGEILCIDFSQTMYQVYVMDFSGKQLFYKNYGRVSGKINELFKVLEKIANEHKSPKLKAIGFGIPAEVSTDKCEITSLSYYEEWNGLKLGKLGKEIFNLTTYLEKDVFLATLAELKDGIGMKYDDFIYLKISRDFSAGIVSNGNLVRGASGTAGQATFSIINKESRGYINGTKGYIDDYACFDTMAEIINNKYYISQKHKKKIINIHSALISNLILVTNPEIIIFSGMATNIKDIEENYLKPLHYAISQLIPIPIPPFSISSLGGNVIARGLALFVLDNIINSTFPYTRTLSY